MLGGAAAEAAPAEQTRISFQSVPLWGRGTLVTDFSHGDLMGWRSLLACYTGTSRPWSASLEPLLLQGFPLCGTWAHLCPPPDKPHPTLLCEQDKIMGQKGRWIGEQLYVFYVLDVFFLNQNKPPPLWDEWVLYIPHWTIALFQEDERFRRWKRYGPHERDIVLEAVIAMMCAHEKTPPLKAGFQL